MIVAFVETSAVVDAIFGFDAAASAALADPGRILFTSRLTEIEVERRLIRAQGEDPARERQARRRLAAYVPRIQLLEMTAPVLARAKEPFRVEPVRALDAIHLSTLLTLLEDLKWCTVLSNDRRIRENAEAYGLTLVPSAGPVA